MATDPREQSGPRSLSHLGPEKYRDIAQLGNGGMGEVYLSVVQGSSITGFNKLLVVKRIRQSFADDPDVLAMFLNEARLAARLNHANVVQTNEVGFDGKRHFIAMEYLDGQSLISVLRRAYAARKIFPLPMHLRVLCESLNGLQYAHELTDFDGTPLNIVHRDATPHNVFITYDGQIKIVDFGIAKVGQTGETRTGEFKGKVPYMAPEQVTQTAVDRRIDIFAVGVMLWEACAGVRMWKGVSDVQIMMRLHNAELPSVTDFAPATHPKLVAIIAKALARNPEERYQTAAAFQADLEAALPALGTPVSSREVGAWVAENFADDRTRIRRAIDSQLKKLKEEPSSMSVPPLQLAGTPGSDPGSDTPQRIEHTPSMVQPQSISAHIQEPRPRSKLGLYGAIGGAIVVAGIITLAVSTRGTSPAVASSASTNAQPVSSNTSPDEPPSGSAPAATVATPAGANTAKVVALHINVNPSDARVYVDDALLTSLDARYAKDGLSHRIRAEAAGYKQKSQWVVFENDKIDLELELERVGAFAPPVTNKPAPPTTTTNVAAQPTTKPSTTVPPATATAAAPESTDKKPPKPPKSSIDTSDPYQ